MYCIFAYCVHYMNCIRMHTFAFTDVYICKTMYSILYVLNYSNIKCLSFYEFKLSKHLIPRWQSYQALNLA
jgi:hypothetical protein